jgi:RNA polymerase primary sigma factor
MVVARNPLDASDTRDRQEAIQLYLTAIGRVPLLTPRQEIELARRIKRGDPKAREQMIRANLRLVVKIARDYEGLGLPLLDLISEGNIGLMKAVERFNPKKGAKLSTYAAWWIKQAVRRALSNQGKTIRLPVHVADQVSQLYRHTHRLTEQLGREPTDDELAVSLDVPAHRVVQLRNLGVRPASLDAPIGDEQGEETSRFSEILQDTSQLSPYELLRVKTRRQDLREQLAHLPPRESAIIAMRYGLDSGEARTLEEVGRMFKVSRERIRQIQDSALAKLRRRLQDLERTDRISRS